ncbi:MAG: c-type cytochrome [Candidatus Binatia bacterium]
MKWRCLGSHRWIILSGCFLFAFVLLVSIDFSGGTSVDEGHEQAGKKSFPTSKKTSGDHDGKDEAPGGHSAQEETHQGHTGAGGRHRYGEVPEGLSPLLEKGFQLMSDLHCNACHYISPGLEHGADHGGVHAAVAPDLTNLGDKFRPGWLFEFLQKPHIIRPWLKIRMPDFRLTGQEAVALVWHISKDMMGKRRRFLPAVELSSAERKTFFEAGKKLMSAEYFDCWSCHQKGKKKPEGLTEGWAPDLEISSQRLRPDWIVQWLQAPQKLVPGTKMPTYFEGPDSGPDEILGGDETKQTYAIVEYILSLSPVRGESSAYVAAKNRHPEATREWGGELMSELNCAGCHDVGGMHERLEAGPPLAHEGSRVRKEWLVGFLKDPSQIRPIGYTGGRSARMPSFRLTHEEAEALAEFLMTLKDKRVHEHAKPQAVQKVKTKKGARLFASLRCEACHPMNGQLERNVPPRFRGPNLAHAGRRLKEDHLKLWLAGDVTRSGSNLEMDAHPVVPAMDLTRKQIQELSAYLTTLK